MLSFGVLTLLAGRQAEESFHTTVAMTSSGTAGGTKNSDSLKMGL